jgi:hypothetical protein
MKPFEPERLDCESFTEYRAYSAVSQSDLKSAYDNPQLYYERHIAKTRAKTPSTPQQRFGVLAEYYLRWHKLPDDIAVIPDWALSANGRRSGAKWKEFEAENRGKQMLTEKEHFELCNDLEAIRVNVTQHAAAYRLLGWVDYSTRWIWTDGDLTYKAEFDVMDTQHKRIVDIKTAADVDAESFQRACITWGYDIQAAHYLTCFPDYAWAWIVIRNRPPFNVEVYELDPSFFVMGTRRLELRIRHFKRCANSGNWVTPTHGLSIPISAPGWAGRKVDDEQKQENAAGVADEANGALPY